MNTAATLATAAVSFGVTAVLGAWMIPLLRRIHFGQNIKEIGPVWHKNKSGTPTMGGIMFIAGITAAAVAGGCMLHMDAGGQTGALNRYFLGLFMALAFGFVGFLDDYISIVKKRNLGLRARTKSVMQVVIAALYLIGLYLMGNTSTIVPIPFLGQIDMGLWYYPFALFVIVGTDNAVNLTDGIDGLDASVTFVVAIGFMLVSALLMEPEMGLLATALAGGCLGFLLWNAHPAKVFMGDTGSLFLGGMVVALAFGLGQPMLLVFFGIIYVVETLSDIIQIGSYKLTHKRVFKMAPIHHHFEMSGWSEKKIVAVFSLVTLAGCAVGLWSVTML